MKEKFSSNSPINNLTEENDYFETLPKANALKNFLEGDTDFFDGNKMIVLFGPWGSGKTSLMQFLHNNLDSTKFKSIFFEAWEHEKDENLGLSLANAIGQDLNDESKVEKFLTNAGKFLKGFAKGITVKLAPIELPGVSYDVEKAINTIEEEFKKPSLSEQSFFKTLEKFKKDFRELEHEIITENKLENGGRIIVFIDDLDRCEPENVLNLITAIKLFFTYGKKTLFLCGIDKKAVSKAVETKYKDVIKSDEYLEKVFDVSFKMPETFNLKKLLENYFPNSQKKNKEEINLEVSEVLSEFLNALKFTNPRHVKKLLNKYEILCRIKNRGNYPDIIPNIIIDGKGGILETIFVLLIIILYDNFEKQFQVIEQIEQKVFAYSNAINKASLKYDVYKYQGGLNFLIKEFRIGLNLIFQSSISAIIFTLYDSSNTNENKLSDDFLSIVDKLMNSETFPNKKLEGLFYCLFLPDEIEELIFPKYYDEFSIEGFIKQFESSEHKQLVRFCLFLFRNSHLFKNLKPNENSNFSTKTLIKMAKTIL